ncbi:LacI family DNA-binding transcriptional regulator [Streptomyces sp. H27-H1]|uniref:LacI family DNA-binding transcriptional regulator n=1 Tax=Streptomyces sp. H27-H1 TaxID=2996461 RepID=UPI00226D8877|nr:LacI family DNA-binding transcriptional regulator [Streptomyces sp. H27-H1]MCY0927939.1 LacI family DNA-binding transcriptional regulator [Streptomyces sp. H27-H1]
MVTHGRTGPTLEEVAALAGVGRGTVSRVVNRAPGVKAATRLLVENAIDELGYVPHHAARALAGHRTGAVALVITDNERRLFAEPFYSEIVRGISTELADREVQLLLTLVRNDRERARFTRYARAGGMDGVLLVSVHDEDPLPDLLAELGLPTVLAGRRSAEESLSYVDSDNVGGARAAVRHLVATGRKAIATITGPLDMHVGQSRLRGYREAMVQAFGGVEPSWIAEGDFSEESGRRGTAELLRRHPGLDAVFAASDLMAAGVLHTLRAAGRRVPEDVGVVGFDDTPFARHTDPQLTSVHQPVQEMGRTMVRMLLQDIDDDQDAAWRHVVLRTKLVRRAST